MDVFSGRSAHSYTEAVNESKAHFDAHPALASMSEQQLKRKVKTGFFPHYPDNLSKLQKS